MTSSKNRDIRALLAVPHQDLQALVALRLEKKGFPLLRPVQTQLLTLIESGGIRLSDLVAAAGLPKQTVGDVIDDLESMKMVERYPDPEHGVIKRVRLGAKGKVWLAEVKRVAAAAEESWASRIGKTKVKALRSLLEELADSFSTPVSDGKAKRRARGK